jgi:hypothetical protein
MSLSQLFLHARTPAITPIDNKKSIPHVILSGAPDGFI